MATENAHESKPATVTRSKSEDVKPKMESHDNDDAKSMKSEKSAKSTKSARSENSGRRSVSTENITGRDIIKQFMQGDVVAMVTYKKICNALDGVESWQSDVAKTQLIEQFIDMGDVLDHRCELLVHKLLRLRWDCIPSGILTGYRKLLCELGVRQLSFTEIVYQSVVGRLAPVTTQSESGETVFELDEALQKAHYVMAHQIIAHILKCFPMSSKPLLKCIRAGFPHYTQSPKKAAIYMRNLIVLQQYAPTIRSDIWEAIISRLVNDDAHLLKSELIDGGSANPALFSMDETFCEEGDVMMEEENVDERLKQLDIVISDIMCYITKIHNPAADLSEFGNDTTWLMLTGDVSSDDFFSSFVHILESKMLMATHVRHVSFIWLYLCSLRSEYTPRLLETLWQCVCRMPRAPVDSKKSQGAAAYLAAFLARAKYVRIKESYNWLDEMFQWMLRYVDQFGNGSSQIQAGLQRHATFYAVCQAFFLVFSFRYRELVKNREQMDEIRHWGLGRVVHSPLEPLKFVSKPVALCFSAISRSLQIVYCNHVIPLDSQIQIPFEEFFPLDQYRLKISGEHVTRLMRRFSPLAEDVSTVSAALSWNAVAKKENVANGENGEGKTQEGSGEMDFLDEDEGIYGSFRERSGTCGATSLLTVYSSSPGLRTFETPPMP